MTRREQAVRAWAGHVLRFGVTPRSLIGFCFPGFEDFQVDRALMREICVELNHRADVQIGAQNAQIERGS